MPRNTKIEWTEVTCYDDVLEEPLRRQRPQMVFVCSTRDLFHKDVPFEFVNRVMQTIVECPQHTFQVLTKRPGRMARWLQEWWRPDIRNRFKRGGRTYLRPRLFLRRPGCTECRYGILGCLRGRKKWEDEPVMPNYRSLLYRDYFGRPETTCDGFEWGKNSVSHGVLVEMNNGEISVRDQDCVGGFPGPLKNLWLGTSIENQAAADQRIPHLLKCPAAVRFLSLEPLLGPIANLPLDSIDWVIVGGESGPGARPIKIAWARHIRAQCERANVPFFMKQMGGFPNKRSKPEDILEDLRIREYPK